MKTTATTVTTTVTKPRASIVKLAATVKSGKAEVSERDGEGAVL